MKEYVQKPGVRPWHGNELVDLQAENMDAIVMQLKKFGAFIIDGIDAAGPGPYSFSPGLAFMEHPDDGWKLVRFSGAVPTGLGGIIYVSKNTSQKLYNDGNNHDALYEYTAAFYDEDAAGYAAFYSGLTDNQRIYITAEEGVYKQGLDVALRGYMLPAWENCTGSILSPVQVSAAGMERRVCYATGQVHLRGSVTIHNPANFGLALQWIPVKVVDAAHHPLDEVFFTGTIKYDQVSYAVFLDAGQVDYLKCFGFSIGTDGKLYMGVVRPLFSADAYTVYFNTSYFFA